MDQTLTTSQVQQFINDGFVRIDHAFPKGLAAEARDLLWRDTGCDPNDRSTWTKPVIRLGEYAATPFREAVNTPILHNAFDQLVGKGNWFPRQSLGSFPIRFPMSGDPGDSGWHVDSSFPGENPNDYSSWRINVRSRGRALLMLFLFSDTGERDAPTRIRIGSHLDVANILEPAGENGMAFMEVARHLDKTSARPTVLATGEAGTVYLCHPFLVHAAQAHHGEAPRFLAQPPLLPKAGVKLQRDDGKYSPLETAIRVGLRLS